MKKTIKTGTCLINRVVFQASLVFYLLLTTFDVFTVKDDTFFFDVNWLILIIGVSGLFLLILDCKQEQKQQDAMRWWQYLFIFLISIVTGILVFISIKDMQWLAYIISACCFLLIFLISYFIIIDKDENIVEKNDKRENKKKASDINYFILKIILLFLTGLIVSFYVTVELIGAWAFLLSLAVGFIFLFLSIYIFNKQ